MNSASSLRSQYTSPMNNNVVAGKYAHGFSIDPQEFLNVYMLLHKNFWKNMCLQIDNIKEVKVSLLLFHFVLLQTTVAGRLVNDWAGWVPRP